jgi:hypothetical protein
MTQKLFFNKSAVEFFLEFFSMKSALEGGSKWGVNFCSKKSAVKIVFYFFSMKSAVKIFDFFSMKTAVENFFYFFLMKSAVEFFSSTFCSKSLKTKNFTPDAPTDLGDFSFFALSLISYRM